MCVGLIEGCDTVIKSDKEQDEEGKGDREEVEELLYRSVRRKNRPRLIPNITAQHMIRGCWSNWVTTNAIKS